MKVQEVMMRAMSGQISWLEAAEILRWSLRTLRRWRWRYEKHGYDGLYDRRKKRPSPKRVPLKTAGLVARHKRGQKHRQERERRPMRGMLVHVDGSTHAWIAGAGWQPDLMAFLDDATGEVYEAFFCEEEGTMPVLAGLQTVIEEQGLFCSLYTDRGSHFFHTPEAGAKVDRTQLTQVGRALAHLGIEHIPSYSPQAGGRMERFFGTWQGRLPQELARAGITTLEAANRYLKEVFMPWHNRKLAVAPRESGSAFVPVGGADLTGILCVQEERVVNNDNTVSWGKKKLQIGAQDWRGSLAKCRVKVCEHTDHMISVRYGPRVVGWYDAAGQPLKAEKREAA